MESGQKKNYNTADWRTNLCAFVEALEGVFRFGYWFGDALDDLLGLEPEIFGLSWHALRFGIAFGIVVSTCVARSHVVLNIGYQKKNTATPATEASHLLESQSINGEEDASAVPPSDFKWHHSIILGGDYLGHMIDYASPITFIIYFAGDPEQMSRLLKSFVVFGSCLFGAVAAVSNYKTCKSAYKEYLGISQETTNRPYEFWRKFSAFAESLTGIMSYPYFGGLVCDIILEACISPKTHTHVDALERVFFGLSIWGAIFGTLFGIWCAVGSSHAHYILNKHRQEDNGTTEKNVDETSLTKTEKFSLIGDFQSHMSDIASSLILIYLLGIEDYDVKNYISGIVLFVCISIGSLGSLAPFRTCLTEMRRSTEDERNLAGKAKEKVSQLAKGLYDRCCPCLPQRMER